MTHDIAKRWIGSFLGLLFVVGSRSANVLPCPPTDSTRSDLEALKTNNYEVADDQRRNALALSLAGCLSSPDPELRDAVAFEALSHMMRQRQLRNDTMTRLKRELEPRLRQYDASGFIRPFAALTLSEVARADRLNPFLSPDARNQLLLSAISYFAGIRDYRGFDDREGWRHGIAHGSDLLMQLSLNPRFGRQSLDRIRAALETQIAPRGHFYIYGESDRIASVVIALAERGVYSEADWEHWLRGASTPSPFADWKTAYSSQAGLARIHDVSAFLSRIFIDSQLTSDQPVGGLRSAAEAAIRLMP